MPVNVWYVLLLLGLIQGLFLMVVLFLMKGKRRLSIVILNGLVVCLLSLIVLQILRFHLPEEQIIRLYAYGGGVPLLIGPLLFLYLRSVVDPAYTFQKSSWIHFVPLALYLLLVLTSFGEGLYNHAGFIVLKALHTLIYFGFSFYYVKSVTHLSTKKVWYNKGLLLRLLASQIFAVILIYVLVAIDDIWGWIPVDSDMISSFIFIVFFFALLLLIILQPASTIPDARFKGYYLKSDLDENRKSEILERLNTSLKEEKTYLNPQLSLSLLAEKIEVNPHQLSQVINEFTGKNFNQLINEYRVEDVKLNITDPTKSLLGIAYDSGFQSKSAFNRIFKELEGQTPSAYKKSLQKMSPDL